ncbi:hypothetical protein WEI85_00875 [Actinomycetes bacterium KLBMP 9797]
MRVGADVTAGAGWAGDLAGEVVVGGACRLVGCLTALDEDLLGEFEGDGVDDGLVGVHGDDLPEQDFAEVYAVGEYVGHGLVAPRHHPELLGVLAGDAAAKESSLVEGCCDGAAPEPAACVQVEDLLNDANLVLNGDERVVGILREAVRYDSEGPLALGGFAFHAVDDPVDDHFALEFGEDAEHLDQHSAGWGRGVERLGRGAEDDPGVVQFVEQGD